MEIASYPFEIAEAITLLYNYERKTLYFCAYKRSPLNFLIGCQPSNNNTD